MEEKKIFAYVIGEEKYGLSTKYDKFWTDKARENSKKVCSKKVRCLNDNKDFSSMGEASKYYGISTSSVSVSISQNRKILCKKDNIMYQFVLI